MLGISSNLAVPIADWRLNPKRIWQRLIENTFIYYQQSTQAIIWHTLVAMVEDSWGPALENVILQTACCVLINVEQYLLSSWLQGRSLTVLGISGAKPRRVLYASAESKRYIDDPYLTLRHLTALVSGVRLVFFFKQVYFAFILPLSCPQN